MPAIMLAAVMAWAAPGTATAAPLLLEVQAGALAGDASETLAGTLALLGEKTVWGWAYADRTSTSSAISAGHLPTCPPLGSCASSTTPATGVARAEVDATTGTLKARAVAIEGNAPTDGSADASVKVGLNDVITLTSGPALLDVRLDVPVFRGDDSRLRFSLIASFGETSILSLLDFTADASGYELRVREQLVESGSVVPDRIDRTLDVSGLPFLPLSATLWASTSQSGRVVADNSVYLGLRGGYTSVNGFRYTFDPTTPSAPVPEPAGLALVLGGVALAGVRRRRAARPRRG